MSHLLVSHESVGDYPTFRASVEDLGNWLSVYLEEFKTVLRDAKTTKDRCGAATPWAIDQMIVTLEDQIRMAETLPSWIRMAKQPHCPARKMAL